MPRSLSHMKKKARAGVAGVEENAVIIPTKNDVVLGRGRATLGMAGNINFRRIVGKFRDVYSRTHPIEKCFVCKAVLDEIQKLEPPGRFLCKHPKTGEWEEVTDRRVYEKVSQSLREKKFRPPREKELMKLVMYQNNMNVNVAKSEDRAASSARKKPAPHKGTSDAAKSKAAAAIKPATRAKAAESEDSTASSAPKNKQTSGAAKSKAVVAIKAATKPAKKKSARSRRNTRKASSPHYKKKNIIKAKETQDAGLRDTAKTAAATSSPAREPAMEQGPTQQGHAVRTPIEEGEEVITPSSSSASPTTFTATTNNADASRRTSCGLPNKVVTPNPTTGCTSPAPSISNAAPASTVRRSGWILRPSKPSDYVGLWGVLFPLFRTEVKPTAEGFQSHVFLQSSPALGNFNNAIAPASVNAMLFGGKQQRQYQSGGCSVSGGINVQQRGCGVLSDVKGCTHVATTQIVPQNLFSSATKTIDFDGCNSINNIASYCDNAGNPFCDFADHNGKEEISSCHTKMLLSCEDASLDFIEGEIDLDLQSLLFSPDELDKDPAIKSNHAAADDDGDDDDDGTGDAAAAPSTRAGDNLHACDGSADLLQTSCSGRGGAGAHEDSIWCSWNSDSTASVV